MVEMPIQVRAIERRDRRGAVALARLGRIAEARVAGCQLAAVLPQVSRDPRAVVNRLTADQALVDELVEALALAGLG